MSRQTMNVCIVAAAATAVVTYGIALVADAPQTVGAVTESREGSAAIPPAGLTTAPTPTASTVAAAAPSVLAPPTTDGTTAPVTAASAPEPALLATVQAPGGIDWRAAPTEWMGCVRRRESTDHYGAINWTGPWFGAWQFTQQTWNWVARDAGRLELVGVRPDHASPFDQDDMAWHLLYMPGGGPRHWPQTGAACTSKGWPR